MDFKKIDKKMVMKTEHLEGAKLAGFKTLSGGIYAMMKDIVKYPTKAIIFKTLHCGLEWWEKYIDHMEACGVVMPERPYGYARQRRKIVLVNVQQKKKFKPKFTQAELEEPECDIFGMIRGL